MVTEMKPFTSNNVHAMPNNFVHQAVMNGSAAVRQLIYKYKMKSCPFSMQLRYVRPSRPNQTHIRKTKLTSAKSQGMRPAPFLQHNGQIHFWHVEREFSQLELPTELTTKLHQLSPTLVMAP